MFTLWWYAWKDNVIVCKLAKKGMCFCFTVLHLLSRRCHMPETHIHDPGIFHQWKGSALFREWRTFYFSETQFMHMFCSVSRLHVNLHTHNFRQPQADTKHRQSTRVKEHSHSCKSVDRQATSDETWIRWKSYIRLCIYRVLRLP